MGRVLKEFLTWRARETMEGGGFMPPPRSMGHLASPLPRAFARSLVFRRPDPLPSLLATHLLARFVLAQPDIDRLPQEIVGGPGEKGDLGHQFRLDPMHARQHERRAEAR